MNGCIEGLAWDEGWMPPPTLPQPILRPSQREEGIFSWSLFTWSVFEREGLKDQKRNQLLLFRSARIKQKRIIFIYLWAVIKSWLFLVEEENSFDTALTTAKALSMTSYQALWQALCTLRWRIDPISRQGLTQEDALLNLENSWKHCQKHNRPK